MKRQILMVILAALAMGIASPTRGESASVLLEKGIFAEETKGDLDEAIGIYKQIVEDAKANRRYVAEAQYRLGVCLEKKGRHKASQTALMKVVSEFPEQKELVAKALKKIDRIVDKIDHPFVDDPTVVGKWQSVDFVDEIKDFTLGKKRWKGDLYLKELIFHEGGKTFKPFWTWTKGLLIHHRDKTAARYVIRDISGATYMFLQWKSGDYTLRGMRPKYYVLKRHDVDAVVSRAVTTISTCAEGDPRLNKALATLENLDEKTALEQVRGFLKSQNNEVRRAAIYVLYKGSFENIEAVTGDLMNLCAHPEEFTRGMAALALGEHKIAASFLTLSEMAVNDKSGYARRCAAYALGLLGRSEASEILEKASKDPDPLVRANAKRALKMLPKVDRNNAQPVVVRTNPQAFANDLDSSLKKITVTFDREMMVGSYSWVGGGETFPKTTGKPHYDPQTRTICTLPVKLKPAKVYWIGINSPSHKFFQTVNHIPARPYVIFFATRDSDGKPTPLPPDMLAQAKTINARSGKPSGRRVPSGKALVLSHDDGKKAGRRSMAGSGHGVRFEASAEGCLLTSVSVHGSRYGEYDPPQEDFDVWLRDANYNELAEFSFPYATFKRRGRVKWARLNVTPTPVPRKFSIFVAFDPHKSKGVYVSYDKAGSGNSLTGIPGGEIGPFEEGDWMIRVTLRKAEGEGPEPSHTASEADLAASEELAGEGWRLWGWRKLVEAEQKFKQAVKKNPSNANAWNGLGWSQFNQGKPINANISFRKCLSVNPQHAAALNGLGWIAKNQGKTDEAIGHWHKAVAAAPSATAALSGLAQTYMELNRYEQAVKYYRMWVKAEPNNAEAKAGLKKAEAALNKSK